MKSTKSVWIYCDGELVRLVPTMKASCEGNLEVINELFTTANYDACIMGKRVLEHPLAQGCMGIYVTHLEELGEECPGAASGKKTGSAAFNGEGIHF